MVCQEERFSAALVFWVLVAAVSAVQGSMIQEISFEETARIADIIVVGRSVESPEYGTYEPRSGVVVRRHRFQVHEYLKGTGPSEIEVATLGGKFQLEREGRLEDAVEVAGGQPQLPEEPVDMVLFLTGHGRVNAFMICSASYGVVRVKRNTETGESEVLLVFGEPEVMPEEALAQYRLLEQEEPTEGRFVRARVAVRDLKRFVARALAPRRKRTSSLR